MTKVLYIVNTRMPTEKACGWQTVKSVEAWEKLGVKIKLVVPKRRNYIREGVREFYNLRQELDIKYLGGRFVSLEKIKKSWYFHWQRMEFGIWCFFYALFSRVSIIYSRSITLCFFLNLFGKLAVYEDHEPKNHFVFFYRLFTKVIKKKVLVAYNLQEIYYEFGVDPKSYIVAPNGVDWEEFEQVEPNRDVWKKEFGLSKEEKIVLYVGHFYAWKGVYTLLDASPGIKGKVVLIGGTREDGKEIENYIADHSLQNIYLKDFTSHWKVITYLKSADVLVLPNTQKEERSAKYTTPIKLFEYLAAGVPIVASDLPSFSYYLKNNENSYLVVPDNAKILSEKINFVLDKPEQNRAVAEKAQSDVKQYSWKRRMENINSFIFSS